jgi:hypothetical protein
VKVEIRLQVVPADSMAQYGCYHIVYTIQLCLRFKSRLTPALAPQPFAGNQKSLLQIKNPGVGNPLCVNEENICSNEERQPIHGGEVVMRLTLSRSDLDVHILHAGDHDS